MSTDYCHRVLAVVSRIQEVPCGTAQVSTAHLFILLINDKAWPGQALRISKQSAIEDGKLSALRTGRLYRPVHIPVHISVPRATVPRATPYPHF
jgi:hypothetical protein